MKTDKILDKKNIKINSIESEVPSIKGTMFDDKNISNNSFASENILQTANSNLNAKIKKNVINKNNIKNSSTIKNNLSLWGTLFFLICGTLLLIIYLNYFSGLPENINNIPVLTPIQKSNRIKPYSKKQDNYNNIEDNLGNLKQIENSKLQIPTGESEITKNINTSTHISEKLPDNEKIQTYLIENNKDISINSSIKNSSKLSNTSTKFNIPPGAKVIKVEEALKNNDLKVENNLNHTNFKMIDINSLPTKRPVNIKNAINKKITQTAKQSGSTQSVTEKIQNNKAESSIGPWIVQLKIVPTLKEANEEYYKLKKKYFSVLGSRTGFIRHIRYGINNSSFQVAINGGSNAQSKKLCYQIMKINGQCTVIQYNPKNN